MKSHLRLLLPLLLLAVIPVTHALAATVPVVENFETDASDWTDAAQVPLTFHASGGPDGSSYVSGSFTFAHLTEAQVGSQGGSPLVIRGQTEPLLGINASDGALFGNWLEDGVAEFRVMVRHNAPEPLSMYIRFAAPSNSPYVIANIADPIPSNEWTELIVPISADNPQWTYHFGGYPWPFSPQGVGVIQLGVAMPASLAGDPGVFSLDIDSIGLYPVPEPSAWVSLTAMCVALLLTRRHWRRGGV